MYLSMMKVDSVSCIVSHKIHLYHGYIYLKPDVIPCTSNKHHNLLHISKVNEWEYKVELTGSVLKRT